MDFVRTTLLVSTVLLLVSGDISTFVWPVLVGVSTVCFMVAVIWDESRRMRELVQLLKAAPSAQLLACAHDPEDYDLWYHVLHQRAQAGDVDTIVAMLRLAPTDWVLEDMTTYVDLDHFMWPHRHPGKLLKAAATPAARQALMTRCRDDHASAEGSA
jgi:hypothetical protein